MVRKMRAEGSRRSSEDRVTGNKHVRVEIQAFLQALDSYPACFAENPTITFEEHRASVMALARVVPALDRPRHARYN